MVSVSAQRKTTIGSIDARNTPCIKKSSLFDDVSLFLHIHLLNVLKIRQNQAQFQR